MSGAALQRLVDDRAATIKRLEANALELSARAQSTADALREAEERDAATDEILRVISRSRSNVQAVFDAIVANASRLAGVRRTSLLRYDGHLLHPVALYPDTPDGWAEIRTIFPRPAEPNTVVGRAVLERVAINVADVRSDDRVHPDGRRYAEARGYRSFLAVPLVCEGEPVGILSVARAAPGEFTEKQVALLQRFADQAVIAIENARLFTELQDKNRALTTALDQQTATAEILRVIASSATDVQPVFDAIVQSARRLLRAHSAGLFLRVGGMVDVAGYTSTDEAGNSELRSLFPMPLERLVADSQLAQRAWDAGETVQDPDVDANPDLSEAARRLARARGFRSRLVVPLRREGGVMGILVVTRREAGRFADDEIALLKTFADQAVIAIENARLFAELHEKNEALTDAHARVTEALEQQTATAQILRVISQSPTDEQPVFEAIAESAATVCGAKSASVFRFDGRLIHFAAHYAWTRDELEALQRVFPIPPGRGSMTARAISTRAVAHVTDIAADPEFAYTPLVQAGFRTVLAVPMLRDGEPIGAISIGRHDVKAFSEQQIALLQTFADQAVIAIENVRLFTELQEKNRALTVALDQQTATSEILRVISSSPTDVQPVFDAIVHSSVRLLRGFSGVLMRVEGDELHLSALTSTNPSGDDAIRAMFPIYRNQSPNWLAVDERHPVVVEDTETDRRLPDVGRQAARARGVRSRLYVPMLHAGTSVGLLVVTRQTPGPFSADEIALLTTFADQAVIAVENVRLFTELEARNAALSRSLAQQTATAEILRAISTSPTNEQPVFDSIVRSAVHLLGGHSAAVRLLVGEQLRVASFSVTETEGDEPYRAGQMDRPLSSNRHYEFVIRERLPRFVDDTETDPFFPDEGRGLARRRGYRSMLTVPLLRGGDAIGVINVTRRAPGPFAEAEARLLQTFADQAVIAIENVRLFTELQEKNAALTRAHAQTTEALDRQTASAEILRAISQSQTDLQPVFETIVRNAARLCNAAYAGVYRFDGELLHSVAHEGYSAEELTEWRKLFPLPASSAALITRAVQTRSVVRVDDVETDSDMTADFRMNLRKRGVRSVLNVPMLRQGEPIGALSVVHREPVAFTEAHLELLRTFADQGVIAIENARLLDELQSRNREVTTALDRQTATAEILQVISRSQADVQPVFEAIASNAQRLFDARTAGVYIFDGELLHIGASIAPARGPVPFPMRPSPILTVGRCALARSVIHVPDVQSDPEASEASREVGRLQGWRSGLAVPMMRKDDLVGVVFVSRVEAGAFEPAEIELLKTFADQAVIAIQNARVLTELQARTEQLSRSVEQLTALGEVGRAVSSTLDLETVLTTIVARAVQLSQLDGGVVFEYDEAAEEFTHRAASGQGGALAAARRAARIGKGEGVLGRTAITLEPVQVPDILAPGAYESRLRENLIESGVRALLAVPMVREGHILGSLVVNRNTPGDFPTETIELLRTFATQSALAIQNARLFQEIEEKSRQLEVANCHKDEFLANMSHELRTPLNGIIGFSEVMLERMFGDLSDKQEEYLKDILESGRHLLSLINDILDLSKIEAGKMELDVTEFHVPTAIDNALTLMRERAARRGQILERAIDPRLGMIRGDERKVKQVLLNLLSNAVKFTPEGGRITVGGGLSNGEVLISVTDTGVGIAPEHHSLVFEEFRQVGHADKKAEGTGLGLALCRKFVELHGGRMSLVSELGKGSTFTFTLPVASTRPV